VKNQPEEGGVRYRGAPFFIKKKGESKKNRIFAFSNIDKRL
jgi:hypothetical protein